MSDCRFQPRCGNRLLISLTKMLKRSTRPILEVTFCDPYAITRAAPRMAVRRRTGKIGRVWYGLSCSSAVQVKPVNRRPGDTFCTDRHRSTANIGVKDNRSRGADR